jgi:hypothetical protein
MWKSIDRFPKDIGFFIGDVIVAVKHITRRKNNVSYSQRRLTDVFYYDGKWQINEIVEDGHGIDIHVITHYAEIKYPKPNYKALK